MKECNWCKKEVDEKAKICPYCGKSIWDKKHKKGIKIVGIVFLILLLLLLIIIVILALNNPKVEDKCKNAEYVTLEDIYDLHSKDKKEAEEKYEGKYFKLKGKISKKLDSYTKIESNYVTADVYFASNYKDDIKKMNVNDEITYCGKVDYGISIKIKNTMIIDER